MLQQNQQILQDELHEKKIIHDQKQTAIEREK